MVNDLHDQIARTGTSTQVVDRKSDGVDAVGCARLVLGGVQGVAVGQRAGACIKAVQCQSTFAGVDHNRCGAQGAQLGERHGGATHDDAGQTVGSCDGDRASGGLAGVAHAEQAQLIDAGLAGGDAITVHGDDGRHAISAAIDGYGQRCCCCITVAVGQGIGVAVSKCLSILECVNRWQAIIQSVGIGAVVI